MNTRIPVTRELLQQRSLPVPGGDADKDERGKALIVGSSLLSGGAASLSGLAAFRAGAGKVTLAVPAPLALLVGVTFPEAGVLAFAADGALHPQVAEASQQIAQIATRCDALLIGPGLADAGTAQSLALALLKHLDAAPMVVDALALGGLWADAQVTRRHGERLLITPHAGEMATLMNVSRHAIEADPLRVAREAADHLGCLVVLKGAQTVIAQPHGGLYLHEADLPGLATSGSGDVLAGTLVGLLARGAEPLSAALHAVSLHAEAGQRLATRVGPLGFLARELPEEIPALLLEHCTPEPSARARRA